MARDGNARPNCQVVVLVEVDWRQRADKPNVGRRRAAAASLWPVVSCGNYKGGIMRAMSYVTLYRMQQQARQEVQEGKTEAASLRLQHIATCLIHNGERHLAQTALVEAERVRLTGSISLDGEKPIKYGTRARWYDEPVT